MIDGGLLFLSASTVTGGAGGTTDAITCIGGAGGSGLELLQNSPLVSALGSSIGGGPGGSNCSGCPCPFGGPPGPTTRIGSGSVQASGRTALRMTATAAPREFSTVRLDLSGPAGHPVFLAIEGQPNPVFLPSVQSSLLVHVPTVVFFLGFLSNNGTLTTTFRTTRNGSGEARPYWIQAGYLANDMGAVLGTGSLLLLLDQDF